MKVVAIIYRTLKNGKTFDDYRKAWFHTEGFGVPTDMYTVVNAFNPREIISIGIINTELSQVPDLLNIDVLQRLQNPLDDVIEETIVRHFGIVAAEDDFSSAGNLPYKPSEIDSSDIMTLADSLKEMIITASNARDRLKK